MVKPRLTTTNALLEHSTEDPKSHLNNLNIDFDLEIRSKPCFFLRHQNLELRSLFLLLDGQDHSIENMTSPKKSAFWPNDTHHCRLTFTHTYTYRSSPLYPYKTVPFSHTIKGQNSQIEKSRWQINPNLFLPSFSLLYLHNPTDLSFLLFQSHSQSLLHI